MTNEQAIAHFKEQLEVFGGEHHEAMKVAIEALEKQIPKKDSCADYHDVIGQLQEYIRESNNIDYNRALVEAIEVIRKRTCVKDCWIPCSERLPECEWGAETEALLYQTKAGYVRTGYFGRGGLLRDAYFRGYTDIMEGCDASDVIAWMPLPEPYKAGDIDG